jgi:5-hydroxyisourate hydrolase
MSKITTHVLDTVLGKPAAGIQVRLQKLEQDHWSDVGTAETDQDGRCGNLASNTSAGRYRLIFQTGEYFSRQGRATIYPEMTITFQCDHDAHYHLPLLMSDNSYTTYRGS